MKTTQPHRTDRSALIIALLIGLGALNSHAQFNSGSDGSYGPINITTNTTLAMPTNGIFQCTTITVASNATLWFTPNALNTPVYLLATNNVTINGTIDVSGTTNNGVVGGAGGPGGFAGGDGSIAATPPGDGKGPGAGRAGTPTGPYTSVGSAGYGTPVTGGSSFVTNNGTPYGSPLLVPLVGGSGGGGRTDGKSGAGGGGAILLASNTRIDVLGTILSSSRDLSLQSVYGLGSGGAIRLVAPVVSGGGTLNVKGGVNTAGGWYVSGGSGRIRIDCLDHRTLALTFAPTSSVASVGAYLVTFPTNAPRLDITQVAGNNIPVGTSTNVFFFLPENSSTNQTVTVQASNFGAPVPIRVVLTPDNGPSSSYDAQIDNNTVNPASTTVPVVVPVNVRVQVNAWTR